MSIPVALKRCSLAGLLAILAVLLLGAGDNEARFDRLGHRMMCV